MPAYIVVETDIRDAEQYELYKQASPAAVETPEKAASSRAAVSLQFWRAIGNPSAYVLLEFPDLAAAKRFYESPEYQVAKRLREGAADFNMVAVQGLA